MIYLYDRVNRQNLTPQSNNNIYPVLLDEFFGISMSNSPLVNILSFTKNKISDEIGHTTCDVIFNCDGTISQWEARATNETILPQYGAGLLVGSGSGFSPNQQYSFNVDYSELTQGDREYKITIYVQVEGVWYG